MQARESDVGYGTALLPDPRVRNYWDPNEALGKAYAQQLGIEGGPAWDVYFLYGKGARWVGSMPPKPAFWMHQLAVTNAPRLDPTVFRQHVEQLLAQ
ncbi:MAG TPA: hypothetical protein VFE35_01515 [Candidatus Cybelea sp.]|nr:hypothetical protein [Candidatus Cybelea sp.]